ncbi:endonuclease-reverse transcriptase [Elysia marginata]|uniref:Endonuclease-reverse transcriptase n=1 Tax=Elysia marginata TaxID=1093978 RepID=A0AAV4I3P2_9GAST|nr:endonuclease-reverse transcriptase [Elysia marginata]
MQKFYGKKELLRRNVGLNTKKRILACYIFSVFNYSCEAWTYSKTVQKKIQTFEMWCYRRLLKVPWTEKKTNKEIEQMDDVGEILLQQLNMKRKLRYAGHIMRGSSGPLLQLPLEGKIEGKRGQGRPRRNWMDDVKEWSGSTSYGDTKRKAENREEWRDMVANLRTEEGT